MSEERDLLDNTTPHIIIHSPSTARIPYFDEEDVIEKFIVKDEDYFGHDGEHLEIPGPLPEGEFGNKAAALRRNSISLPSGINTLDLELLRLEHANHPANGAIPEHGNGSDSNSYSGDHDESDEANAADEENQRAKVPTRSYRKKSVMPGRAPDQSKLQIPKNSDSSTIDSDDDSPVNSITSINSLASLLKEKLQSIPSKIKKKPTDFKIRAFVGFLFLCIIFFVGFAYIMYHQQVLARAYFDKIKFNKGNRIIKIFNQDSVEILVGSLGVTLGTSKAYTCLEHDENEEGSLCLEWLSGHRLYINRHHFEHETDDVRCYHIRWQALIDGAHPTDCYDWSAFSEHWYGGGQSANMSWPIESISQDYAPFVTGDVKKHQWGNAIKRYFISSRGAAIVIDDNTPLYLAIKDRKICMKAKHDEFAFVNRLTKYPELSYKLCTSKDVNTLHSALSQKSLWDGLKENDISILESLLSEPVWHIAPRDKESLTGDLIQNYTEDVIDLGFLKQGHVLINEFWQNHMGDFELDESRFQSLGDTVNIIHRRGFKIAFTIQPFISTASPNFAECLQKKIFISERFSDLRIPALTRYKSVTSAGVLDITNNQTSIWLREKLNKVIKTYQIDAFFLDLGTAYNMPHYYQCKKMLRNPDQYKTLFTDSFHHSINLLGVSSAVSLPRPPVFVSLPPFASTWDAIKMLIPTILSYGTIGYPFVMPGAIGGDIDWPGGDQFVPGSSKPNYDNDNNEQVRLPEKELYLRWLQLATFLPVMKFTHLPSKYNDEQILEVAKILTNTRQKVVLPIINKYYKESLDRGIPFIRPLWMLEPSDLACQTIDDEFSIGEEIIVAPVLEKGATNREVYLPSGVWKDGIDGSLRKGSRWIHDYRVPLDKVAYFLKLPDNTRF